MSSLPITPPTARAGTALGKSTGSPPGGPSGDFAALLTQTSARTAHAEGPKTRPHQETRRDAASSRRDDRDDAQAATAAKADDGRVATESQAAQQPAAKADDATTPQPGQEAPQDAPQGEGEQPQPQPPADPAAAAAAAQLAALQTATAPTTGRPGTAAPATGGQPALGADGLPADAQALLAQAADGQPVADPKAQGAEGGKLAIPAELLNGKGQAHAGAHGKDFTQDGAKQDLPPAPTLPPAVAAAPANAPAAAPAAEAATAPQAAPATPGAGGIGSQAQPTATPLTAVPTAAGSPQLTKGSVLQTAERVQELVRIATTRNGQARATLQLKPEALGQVDVHLRTTREGLVATIAAHDQAGLDALQQAGGELRRLLEDRGVQLQSLDLQLSAGGDSGFGARRDASDAESSRSGVSSSYGLDDDGDEVVDETELSLTPAPLTTTSALVDVTA
jgi:flagellar hook-length control protein FliK